MGSRIQWAGLFLAFCVFMGCEDISRFNTKYVPPRIKPPPKRRLMVRKQSIGFVYVPVNKRDPFRAPFETSATVTTNKPSKTVAIPTRRRKPRTELEKYELDQLSVVATVTGVANPVAMVQDPKGFGHMVRRGTVIGRNSGRVQRIHSDGIVIAEESRDEAGRRIVSRLKLKIKNRTAKGAGGSSFNGRLLIGNRQVRLDQFK
ncbi:MAG: hypothetical protein EP343_08790 [Deltaproteobacteria bacterium]|nr:MAG: hypothetical protein EP343_08790 [Deltaproteobacteria bacterium]